MLNKEHIIEKLKTLQLQKDQYCVMTGAAMVLHGIKEYTADIDLGCSTELFENLVQRGYKPQQIKSNYGIIIDDCIEIFRNWQAEKLVYIEGIPVADICCIRKYKHDLARPKDMNDIKLIDEFLASKADSEMES